MNSSSLSNKDTKRLIRQTCFLTVRFRLSVSHFKVLVFKHIKEQKQIRTPTRDITSKHTCILHS